MLVTLPCKELVATQLTREGAIVQLLPYGLLQPHGVKSLLARGYDPRLPAREGVLKRRADGAIQPLDRLRAHTLPIRRIHHDESGVGRSVVERIGIDRADIEVNVLLHAGTLDIRPGDGDRLRIDVRAIDLMLRLHLIPVLKHLIE